MNSGKWPQHATLRCDLAWEAGVILCLFVLVLYQKLLSREGRQGGCSEGGGSGHHGHVGLTYRGLGGLGLVGVRVGKGRQAGVE